MLPLRVECIHHRDNGIKASEPIVEFLVKRLLRGRLSAWVGCEFRIEALPSRTISDSSLHQCTMFKF